LKHSCEKTGARRTWYRR
jgi:hypothetical protein